MLLKLMARGALVPADAPLDAGAQVRAIERIAGDPELSVRLDLASEEEVRAVFVQIYAEELEDAGAD